MDLFGHNHILDKPELLRDKFIEPPFSILDSKTGSWRKRVNKWKKLGIVSEIGRDAKTRNGNLNKLIIASGNHIGHTHTDTSIFDPALCELIYHWFAPENGKILDPFAGGSVRGIVANYLNYNYTGIDIRQEQIDSNIIQGKNILGTNQPKWISGDSNVILDTITGDFDLLFSCPPYADLEVYSDKSGDISNMKYEDFLKAYKSIIKKSCKVIKPNGYAVFVVGEVRDKKGNFYGFVPDTIQSFKEAGMKYYNECIYLQGLAGACLTAGRVMGISKKVKKIHQNVLIFKKCTR